MFDNFFLEFINIGPMYIEKWVGGVRGRGGWWKKLKQRRNKTQIVYCSLEKFTVGYFRVKFVCGEIFLSLGVSNE